MTVLVGLGLLAGFAGCLFDPFYGLLALIGINIIQPGELYPLFNALHVERVMALLTLAMTVMRGVKFYFPAPVKWSLIVFGVALASVPLSFWVTNALINAADFGKVILAAVLVAALVTTEQRLRTVLLSYSILSAYLAVTSLVAYAQGNFMFRMNVDRAVGLTSDSNNPDTLGLTIATAVPLLYLFTLAGNPTWLRWTMRALLVVCFWALLLTGSRGSVLTMTFMLALAAAASRRRAWMLPLAIAAALAVWVSLPAQYQARYSTVNHLQGDESYQNRVISWRGGWHMFLSNPLTGIGIGDYTDANGEHFWPGPGRKRFLNAHSLYLQLLGELGLAGVVAFTGFVYVLFRSNRRLCRELAAQGTAPAWMRYYPWACSLAVFGLLYSGYAYHDLYRSTWYFLAATTAAMGRVRSPAMALEPQRLAGVDRKYGAPAMAPALVAGSGEGVNWSVAP